MNITYEYIAQNGACRSGLSRFRDCIDEYGKTELSLYEVWSSLTLTSSDKKWLVVTLIDDHDICPESMTSLWKVVEFAGMTSFNEQLLDKVISYDWQLAHSLNHHLYKFICNVVELISHGYDGINTLNSLFIRSTT